LKFTPRIVPEFASINPADWDILDHADNPFLSHAFLGGLETSGSVGVDNGWRPHHLAVFEEDKLVAFAPTYVKSHSHGEFVFDWAWADAFRRHGLPYYPKLLTAVPYTPVTGPRLLTRQGHPDAEELRRLLIGLATAECKQAGLSSWHCNFTAGDETESFENSGLLGRSDWQFHWANPGYESFEDFLGRLQSRKRKNIRRERSAIAQAGLRFDWKTGDQTDAADIRFIHDCYASTFHAYGNHPALNEAFFSILARGLANRFLAVFASQGDERVAMSLFLKGGGRLYGRYWGCVREIPGLHFEAAYYQGIEYCIRNRLGVFESGAQGEHKISRGFVPSRTRSWHFVRHEAFRNAISEFLRKESGWLDDYRDELMEHSPFRRDGT